jgi:hypothetical protein
LKGPLRGRVRKEEGRGREGRRERKGREGRGREGKRGKEEGSLPDPQLVFHKSDTASFVRKSVLRHISQSTSFTYTSQKMDIMCFLTSILMLPNSR